jgi:hypothetical protein
MKKAIPIFAMLILVAMTETPAQEIAVMYVNATPSLRVRNTPSLDGERIASLDYMSEVRVTRQSDSTVTIDGITGKWVYVTAGNIKGWGFDGDLTTVPFPHQSDFYGVWVDSDETGIETITFSERTMVTEGHDIISDYHDGYSSNILDWAPISNSDTATMPEYPHGFMITMEWDQSISKWEWFISRDKQEIMRILGDGSLLRYQRQ